ncbi:hypothetical protein KORDIASMS9_01814 [Kordia sp. SMS9]|uniref:hypothetical protein n=1 Tax=Kordia sp. SMS9 TaxID=2282170 RepID=UPI000E0D05F6|nr:hypothetical protein [Kordia sp. SMS9]AXG69589.1 hypothetical protein KORDIASMS9_01814 [Kordia sp. SMS9]
MKDKIEKILLVLGVDSQQDEIKWSSIGQKENTKFKIASRAKKAIGNLEIEENTIMMRISATDYNRNYLKAKMRRAFREEGLENVAFSYSAGEPLSSRIIYSNENIDAEIGEQVTLPRSFWINGYDNEVLDCNGFPIGEKHEAIYLGVEQRSCLRGGGFIDAYNKLQLI